mmetsp:Transcript_24345/g.30971  ORF Transcript_24345/g.30971 Transcript_24345/m.30971 type:complete len:81 (+) Transcript_24345:65-307(+)
MPDRAQEVIKYATKYSIVAWKTFRVVLHWGLVPLVLVLGLSTKYQLPTSRGVKEVTPSLRELILPVHQFEDGSTQFLFPL